MFNSLLEGLNCYSSKNIEIVNKFLVCMKVIILHNTLK